MSSVIPDPGAWLLLAQVCPPVSQPVASWGSARPCQTEGSAGPLIVSDRCLHIWAGNPLRT